MPRRLLKHIFAILVLLIVAGCSGSGCGGCAGCGVTPLPQGFPTEARIENAGSVRLTQSGLGFLQNNLGTLAKSLLGGMADGGVLTFEVPKSSGSQFGIDYDICPNGPDPNGNPPKCLAEVDVGNAKLNITTSGPHNITISGPLPLRIQDLPMHIVYFFIGSNIDVTLSGNSHCPKDAGTASFADINITVPISIEIDADPAHSRHGYSKVVIGDIQIDDNKIEQSLKFCGGFDASILNGLKGILVPQLIGPLKDTLKTQIDDQLCQKPNPMVSPACPDGSADDGGVCKYADGQCVSIMLGTDGHMDLSQFLASLSPGTKGGLDFVFAAGGEGGNPVYGNLNPVGSGATLGMFGGTLPTPKSTCVKLANMDPPQGIPIPDEITANTVTGWPAGMDGPHVGIALNERFFNYALAGMYDSGLLCIGISLDALGSSLPIALDSKLLGTFLGVKSVAGLGLQDEPQTLALTIRPSAPPTAVFGNGTSLDTDPLIRLGLKQMSIDFYVWSLDRFVRFMTYTVDIDVPLNLTVTKDGLVPVLEKLNLTNATVTNADLLSDDPTKIAAALTDVVQNLLAGQLGGALPAINLNDQLASLGLTLNIPETVEGQGSPGLRRLDKDSDHYLGIFATLGLASAPPPPPTETKAELVEKEIDPAGLALATVRPDNAPRVRLALSSPQDDGTRRIEYQVRVDGGFWKPWTDRRYVDLQEGGFRIQGKHKVEVRSRVAGQPYTMDETPAVVDVLIDGHAPAVRVKEVEGDKAQILVDDEVSSSEAVFVRYRVDAGSWSGWVRASELPLVDVTPGSDIDVEARDEEGLVGSASQAIRGKPAATSGGGCGCTVAGETTGDGRLAGLLGALLLGAIVRFGKKRRAPRAEQPKPAPEAKAARRPAAAPARTLRSMTALAAVASAGLFAGCNCGNVETSSTGGTTTTTADECPACDKLSAGLAGEYTSAVVVGDTLWVAGYIEKSVSEKGDNFAWGDLAVGKATDAGVEWELVDGVPEQDVDPTDYDVNGFRGGVTDPGDDVGLWTSIAAKEDGTLGVAYYDRTHRSLRFAKRDGATWTVQTVQEKALSDLGRYAKVVWANGAWNIAYLAVEPGEGGAISSGVRLASSADGASWTFEDVYVNPATPCAARYCATGNSCIVETGLCTPKAVGCDPSCSSGQACVDVGGLSCKEERTAAKLETYPEATGLYISMSADKSGLGMVFYDRVAGNLMMASKAGGSWSTAILDGESGGVDTGDVGIGATLAIDGSGVWHVAYSNGYDESLQYLQVKDGVPGTPEVIDDGAGIEGTPFDDGRHIIGDDASIHVTAGGDIHVAYQDATTGKLHYALGTASANGHSWAVKVIEQDGFAGAFSKIVEHQGGLRIVNWYRNFGGEYVGDVAVVKP